MMRVLVLFLMCFCFYLPSTSAELYQNQDYNFQMNIPDGWNDPKKPNSEYVVLRNINHNNYIGRFILQVSTDKHVSSGDTLEQATREQKIDLLNTYMDALKYKMPDLKITYSDFVKIGKNTCMVIRGFLPNLSKLICVGTVFNRTDYVFIYGANDPTGQYEQQFFDMLKTLRPIVGYSDGDFEEEIMYYNDIAK